MNPAIGATRVRPTSPQRPAQAGDVRRAARAFWWTFWLFLAAFGLGIGWDRAWHATHAFQDFYSPPHLFIYATFTLSALSLLRIAWSPTLRACFDHGRRVGVFSPGVPAPLALTGGGYLLVGVAGLLDDVWHTTFGLDETGWSTPHAMLGWGIMLATLGLVAARLALRPQIALSRPALILLALLALSLTATTPLGPLDNYGTKDLIARVAAIPVLARDPAAQHAFRIAEHWNLARTNPAFLPVAAFAAGFALALAHRFSGGGWVFLLVVALATLFATSGAHRTADYFGVAGDRRNWLPVPLLPAALAYLGTRRLTGRERWSWAAAGAIFSLLVAAWWGAGAYALLGVPAMLLGAIAGARAYHALESPTAADVRTLALIAFTTPFAVGVVDLWLRRHVP
ncbi:MAG: hypothetical protein IVW36_08810 [Dehalococcoidia bacterium]|nr:hypothetical protein [Dehalococcoidia bacterium]